jgi:hypothetical protein
MDNVGNHKGWQWSAVSSCLFQFQSQRLTQVQCTRIFIIEGCMTVLAALIGYLFVPTWADDAKFVCFIGFCGEEEIMS